MLAVSVCPVQLVVASPGVICVLGDYPTIKQALNASTPGDTIIVSEGTYAEGEIWITTGKNIIAEGYYTTVTMNVTIINYGIQTETFNFASQICTSKTER